MGVFSGDSTSLERAGAKLRGLSRSLRGPLAVEPHRRCGDIHPEKPSPDHAPVSAKIQIGQSAQALHPLQAALIHGINLRHHLDHVAPFAFENAMAKPGEARLDARLLHNRSALGVAGLRFARRLQHLEPSADEGERFSLCRVPDKRGKDKRGYQHCECSGNENEEKLGHTGQEIIEAFVATPAALIHPRAIPLYPISWDRPRPSRCGRSGICGTQRYVCRNPWDPVRSLPATSGSAYSADSSDAQWS